ILTRYPFFACSAMAPPARQTKSPGWADTTSAVFGIGHFPRFEFRSCWLAVEVEQPRRIADEQLVLQCRLGREQRNEIDEISVVRHHLDVGMRPVGAPDHPLRRRLDDFAGKGHG